MVTMPARRFAPRPVVQTTSAKKASSPFRLRRQVVYWFGRRAAGNSATNVVVAFCADLFDPLHIWDQPGAELRDHRPQIREENMISRTTIAAFAVALAACFNVAGAAAQGTPDYAALIAAPDRSAADRATDARRDLISARPAHFSIFD